MDFGVSRDFLEYLGSLRQTIANAAHIGQRTIKRLGYAAHSFTEGNGLAQKRLLSFKTRPQHQERRDQTLAIIKPLQATNHGLDMGNIILYSLNDAAKRCSNLFGIGQ